MSVKSRLYQNAVLYGEDYDRVRDFLIELDSHNYHFGRWDWMFTFFSGGVEWADSGSLEKISIWEDDGKIVAITTYDSKPEGIFLLTLKGYEYLKKEMMLQAKESFAKDGKLRVLILEGDIDTQNAAFETGLIPTQEKECDAILPINPQTVKYTLPDGFKITSFSDGYDPYKYGECLWKGFNHEMNGEGPFYRYWEKNSESYIKEWDRPNVDLSLKVSVAAPNRCHVSHCGMWYDKRTKSALVEPVATEPAYRKMGLGKAAVLEAVKRCGELGATRAFVGSSQQFYYSIGFRPYATSTWWKEK